MFKKNLLKTFENAISRDEGIYFSRLEEIAENKNEIKNEITREKWQSVEYCAGDINGKMIVAGENTKPGDLVLNPALSGWHKIYIAKMYLASTPNTCAYNNPADSLYIKFSDEDMFSSVNGNNLQKPVKWGSYECVEELFWQSADLTDRKLIIRKPDISSGVTTALCWLRFIPMTNEETEEYREYIKPKRCMHVHYDLDVHIFGIEESDSLARIKPLRETDAEICSHEFVNCDDIMIYETSTTLHRDGEQRIKNFKKFKERYSEYIKREVSVIKENGIKVLAANRMSMASFGIGTHDNFLNIPFVDNNPQFYIKSRLGEEIRICSYAYKQVQDFSINQFKKALDFGYDGVSLIMHRGMLVGFEEPVKERFEKLYKGVDINRVPIEDERLNTLWCSVMTEFMRRLRTELEDYAGKKIHINVILGTTPHGNKRIGIDIKKWAEEGLCDSFCQDIMEVHEILDGCICEDGLIDLEKYAETNKVRPMITRNSVNSEMEPMLYGAAEYQKISDATGVKFYGGILYNPYSRLIKKSRDELLKIGVKNFSYFNYIHPVPDLTQCHIASKLGHRDIKTEYAMPKYYRTLSVCERNIATFDPNWRG